MMLTSSAGNAWPACCRLWSSGVMSCMRVECAWCVVVAVVVCSAVCLNGLCMVLTKGCCEVEVGSIVVVANGDGSCGPGVYVF